MSSTISMATFVKLLAFIVIVLMGIFVVGSILQAYNRPLPLEGESYYKESISILIERNSNISFTLYLPVIYAEGEVTPSLRNLASLLPKNGSVDLSWESIEDTTYLKINSTDSYINLTNSASLEPISGSNIAYESLLFDHSYGENEIQSIILESNSNVSLSFRIEASTNYCSFDDFGYSYVGDNQLRPGTTEFNSTNYHHAVACA